MPRRIRSSSPIFLFQISGRELQRMLTRLLHAIVVLSMLAPNMVVLAESMPSEMPAAVETETLLQAKELLPQTGQESEEVAVPAEEEISWIPPHFEHPEPRRIVRENNSEAGDPVVPVAEEMPAPDPDEILLPPAVPARIQPELMMQAFSGLEGADTTESYVGRYDMPIAEGAPYQEHAAIAFNTAQDEYFMIWQDDSSPEILAGRRVAVSGDTLSDEIVVVTGQIGVPEYPQLLFNSSDGEYMLLWIESNGTVLSDGYFSLPAYNLYLMPLASDGTPQTGSLQLVTDQLTIFDAQHAFSMVYNSTDNEYLVVWTQPPGGILDLIAHPHRLMGHRVDADGTLLGSEVILKTLIVASAAAAYSAESHEYLVTYTRFERYDREYELYAQRRSPATLSLLGTDISVSGGAYDNQVMPDIAVNTLEDEYLLVYNDTPEIEPQEPNGDYDIVGRRFEAGSGAGIGTEISILDISDDLYQPQVQYNPQTAHFVVMGDGYSSGILSGRYLNSEGAPENSMRFEVRNATEYGFGNTFGLAARSTGDERHFRWITTFSRNGDIYASILPDPELLLSSIFNSSGDACISPTNDVVEVLGKPINTLTGGLDFSVEDISFNTSAGSMDFTRYYSSLATDIFTGDLGYGWNYSHNARLIFPSDPEGSPGVVLFQSGAGNQFEFIIMGENLFAPAPGACGSLGYEEGTEPQYLLTDMGQRTYTFDESGRLVSWEDSEGHLWDYSYDANDRLEAVEDETRTRFLAMVYDAQDRIDSVYDHAGREVGFTYDAAGDLVFVQDLNGETWSYTYDSGHRLTEVLDPRGVTVERTEYDGEGRAVRQYDGEDNLVLELTYNADGTSTVEDALGNVSTHTYDSRHTITDIENPNGDSEEKEYDLFFRPISITDEAGARTNFEWSADGDDLIAVVDAEGGQVDLAYDELHNLTEVVDQQGYQSTFEYDGTLLTSSTDALNQTSTYTYTVEGYLETVTDPRGNSTSYTYDAYGQLEARTDELDNSWSYTYDDLGNLIEIIDPTGMITLYEYDDFGRLVKTILNYNPAFEQNDDGQFNIITEYEYDAAGNRTKIIDTYGRETVYEYDDNNRLTRTVDPMGFKTTNTYDAAGNLTVSTDSLGRTTTFAYDDLNRRISTTDALGYTTYTSYNPDSTVASVTDALGRETSYAYDDLKRLVSTSDALGGVTTNEYDEGGNLVLFTDAMGNETGYEYNALGQLISQSDALDGETLYFYDEAGNQIQVVDPEGNATTYTYDELNRVATKTDAEGGMTTYSYNELGSQSVVQDAGGGYTIYVYDTLNRIYQVHDPAGGVTESFHDASDNLI